MVGRDKTRAAIVALRRRENRRRLANATADYFAHMDAAEDMLGACMAAAASAIDVDQEL